MQKAIFSLLILLLAAVSVEAQKTVPVDPSDKIGKLVQKFDDFIGPVDFFRPNSYCKGLSECKSEMLRLNDLFKEKVNSSCRPLRLKLECCYKGKPTFTVFDVMPTNPSCFRSQPLEKSQTGISGGK